MIGSGHRHTVPVPPRDSVALLWFTRIRRAHRRFTFTPRQSEMIVQRHNLVDRAATLLELYDALFKSSGSRFRAPLSVQG